MQLQQIVLPNLPTGTSEMEQTHVRTGEDQYRWISHGELQKGLWRSCSL